MAETNTFYKDLTEDEKKYLRDLKNSKYDSMSLDEINILVQKAQNGDVEAKNKLINANLRMVVAIAKRFTGNNYSFFDLIQDGTVALMNAIDIYDETRSNNFITFAYQVIRWYLYNRTNYMTSSHNFSIEFIKLMRDVNNFSQQYFSINGVKPSSEKIAQALEKNVKRVEEAQIYLNSSTVSLADPILNEESEITIEDSLDSGYVLEDISEMHLLWSQLLQVYPRANLTEKEIEILKKRYGFYNNQKYTYDQIGLELGCSGERVRQLEKNSLARLRIELINMGKGRSRRKRNGQ